MKEYDDISAQFLALWCRKKYLILPDRILGWVLVEAGWEAAQPALTDNTLEEAAAARRGQVVECGETGGGKLKFANLAMTTAQQRD